MNRNSTVVLPVTGGPNDSSLGHLLEGGPAPEYEQGVVTVMPDVTASVRLDIRLATDCVARLLPGQAARLAAALRWQAALAVGPALPAVGKGEASSVWKVVLVSTSKPAYLAGGSVVVAASRGEAAGSVLLTAHRTARLSPEQAVTLADALEIAAEETFRDGGDPHAVVRRAFGYPVFTEAAMNDAALRFHLMNKGRKPRTTAGAVAIGTGLWLDGKECVRLRMSFLRAAVLYLPAGSATELAKGLRWHAALAAGPDTGPTEGDAESSETWRTDKAFTVNPLPWGGWAQVTASMGTASGHVLLIGYETAVLTPREALWLADELETADRSLQDAGVRAGA